MKNININMNLINIATDEQTQFIKVLEEFEEFIKAIITEDDENLIEEFYDVVQVMLTYIDFKGLINKIPDGNLKHYKKLRERKTQYK